MKWRWIHRDSDEPLPEIFVKTKHTAPCLSVCAPEIDVWASMLRIAVWKGARNAISRARFDKNFVNMTKLVTRSLGRLRQSQWTVVPSDKDGGFAFELRRDQVNNHSDLLEKGKDAPRGASLYLQSGGHK